MGKKSYTEYLNNPVRNSFVFDLCDASEVDAIIIQLSITKASDPNGIPTKILQMISEEISPPLSKICNMTITIGTHPEKLRLVNVLPIYKKGSRLLIFNYRPISLLYLKEYTTSLKKMKSFTLYSMGFVPNTLLLMH